MKFNKDLTKTIVIIVLIVILIGIFLVPLAYNSIYNRGIFDGQINIVQTQTETGNIFIINNGTIQSYPISAFCDGGNQNG